MKRTPLRRKTPLSSDAALQTRKPLRRTGFKATNAGGIPGHDWCVVCRVFVPLDEKPTHRHEEAGTVPRKRLTRSGRLKARSKKRVSEDAIRADAKREVLDRAHGYCLAYNSWKVGVIDVRMSEADRAFCEASWRRCSIMAEHVHEPLTRARGGSITDPANMLPVCGGCHRRIHDNPRVAEMLGLLVRSS